MSKPSKFGLIGHNIAYSRSADIFNAIFEIKGFSGQFEIFDLEPSHFEHEFETVLSKGITGLSVTIPYKSKVIPLLDNITPVARSLEAVNSIAINAHRLYGYNTDVYGFSLPLKPLAALLNKGHALILGCGASARAGVYSLQTESAISQFTVMGRDPSNLGNFKNSLKTILINSRVTTALYNESGFDSNSRFTIVVNCTPLGGWNSPDTSPLPAGFTWKMTKVYYDLNYNLDNKVVREATQNNIVAFDGSQMLVGQAVRSFELWTGEYVTFEEVYQRVFSRFPQADT